MLLDAEGRAVNEEVYEDKGKMVFDKKYRVADLPGLWIAGRGHPEYISDHSLDDYMGIFFFLHISGE